MKLLLLPAFFLFFIGLFSTSSLASSSVICFNNNIVRQQINKKTKLIFVQDKQIKKSVWPVANIGFTDACGNCWEYAISAPTWDGIWAVAEMYKNMYEYGFCGYFIQSQ